jgi:osmotically-inducible protein OsmY
MRAVAPKSDSYIQQEVIRELRWDTRVDEADVGVVVDDGVVTLTGTVSSYGKRLAAQEAAHRVAGVLDVANDIKVLVPGHHTRTDTEIAQAVRDALEWSAYVPHEKIQTTVSEGWVTLEGRVTFWREREEVERIVRRLQSVRGVTNKLSVSWTPSVNAAVLRQEIEEALERQAEREARDIKIEVQDGTVKLTGTVRSWREKRAALGSVSHAPGVRSVEDHLRIQPYT